MQLEQLGFDASFAAALAEHPGALAGRICAVHRERYRVHTEHGVIDAAVSGRLRHAAQLGDLPVVGDWVALAGADHPRIAAVLPRRGVLLRKRPDRAYEPQLLAANVDMVAIVTSPNRDFEPRRIERALAVVHEARARPLIVLTKLDAHPLSTAQREDLARAAPGVAVYAVSAFSGEGMAALATVLRPAQTLALLGSSGVGKSTLINAWTGSDAATAEARSDDDKGRHTTTHRELYIMANGALLIDTPGLRELGLWEADAGVTSAFEDIDALARACRFRDCEHQREPGCAVLAAAERGALDPARHHSYHKLRRELAHEKRRHDARALLDHRREVRVLGKQRARQLRRDGEH